jgi:protein gp37
VAAGGTLLAPPPYPPAATRCTAAGRRLVPLQQRLIGIPLSLARLCQSLPWPPHIWIGVSVESNDYAWRADYLRQVPAAIRFISAEPLLGPVDQLSLDGLHWVITGGESGAGHRRCDPAWVREVRDRCVADGVAYFHKQWGGRTPKTGGRMLDGRTWDELPTQSKSQEQTLSLW